MFWPDQFWHTGKQYEVLGPYCMLQAATGYKDVLKEPADFI